MKKILLSYKNRLLLSAVQLTLYSPQHNFRSDELSLANSGWQSPFASPSTPEEYNRRQLNLFMQAKLNPRKDQISAIDAVCKGFETHGRGQLILPCGTGKTVIGLWIKEKLDSKTTIVAVPSIGLVKQTKDEWNREKRKSFDYLCICSDEDVDRNDQTSISSKAKDVDQDFKKVTTDVSEIKKFLNQQSKSKVIYTTYQSLPKLIEANKSAKVSFDLVLADEAHLTTGSKGSLFTSIHDNGNIPAAKRLYMTATPRIASERDEDDLIVDMSDENTYGPEFYRMNFGEAIEKGILSDYKVVVVGIDTDLTLQSQQNLKNLALNKAMEEYNACCALSFHSRRDSAKDFSRAHSKNFPNILSSYVGGEMSMQERTKIIKDFQSIKKPNKTLMASAKCFGIGVNIPSVDLVYFCDPKNSVTDIVQAAGRAFRKDPQNPNKVGLIVVPLLHKSQQELDKFVEGSDFKNVIKVLQALGSCDERMVEKIRKIHTERKDFDNEPKGRSSERNVSARIVSLIGFQDMCLQQQMFSQIITKTSKRLKPLMYRNFEEAACEIRNQQPQRPTSLHDYFGNTAKYADKGLSTHIGIGLTRLIELAKSSNTISELANMIWGGASQPKTFEDAIRLIIELQPTRPHPLTDYFNGTNAYSQKGLFVHAGLARAKLFKLAKDGGLFDGEPSADKIADKIWASENDENKKAPQSFDEAMQRIREKQPSRPIRLSDYFESSHPGGLHEVSLTTYTLINLMKGKEIFVSTLPEIADIIWPESTLPKTFEEAVKRIKEKQPDRPSPIQDYFKNTGNYASRGLIVHTGIGHQRLSNLAKQVVNDGISVTFSVIADMIWGAHQNKTGSPETFEEAIEQIKKMQPDRPKNLLHYFDNIQTYAGKGLVIHIKIGFKALINLMINDSPDTVKKTSYTAIADLIWGKER